MSALRYNRAGQLEPLGVRAAAEKMAIWIAESEKKGELTAEERRLVVAVSSFFADEYTRISTDNERLSAENHELMLERRREADGGDQDDG